MHGLVFQSCWFFFTAMSGLIYCLQGWSGRFSSLVQPGNSASNRDLYIIYIIRKDRIKRRPFRLVSASGKINSYSTSLLSRESVVCECGCSLLLLLFLFLSSTIHHHLFHRQRGKEESPSLSLALALARRHETKGDVDGRRVSDEEVFFLRNYYCIRLPLS